MKKQVAKKLTISCSTASGIPLERENSHRFEIIHNMKTASINLFDSQVFKKPFTFILLLVLVCFALSPTIQAAPAPTLNPPPDGGYRNHNTAEGDGALFSLTTGFGNTAIGFETLHSNTTGSYNVANGHHALFNNTTGYENVATGTGALYYNTTGYKNTASGTVALNSNTTGHDNTATGVFALAKNATGMFNTANGVAALNDNTTGDYNTADGVEALTSNTTGINNTANGFEALFSNTTGHENTANGIAALFSNTTGHENTATGVAALNYNTTGNDNTANGVSALQSNTTGSNNIALGNGAGFNLTTGDNNIDIGNEGVADEANTIRIGTSGTQTSAFIAGISGTAVSGAAVVVDANGQLGVAASSARFKDEIKPMNRASEGILALKPVTFHYRHEIDPKGTPQFGLVAEEVEKVNPDLVARDAQGKPYTVRYDAVNAMLLNEFLKQHRKVQEQEATITQLKSTLAQQQKDFQATAAHQQKQIETLTAGLQKVSAQVEISRPAPQMVGNNQ